MSDLVIGRGVELEVPPFWERIMAVNEKLHGVARRVLESVRVRLHSVRLPWLTLLRIAHPIEIPYRDTPTDDRIDRHLSSTASSRPRSAPGKPWPAQ
jgi:hypothetical protein